MDRSVILAGILRWAAVLLTCLVAAGPLPAQALDALQDEDPEAPWHIVADEVSYDQTAEIYHAVGNAEIFKSDRRLKAHRISFDQKNMTAQAEGQVMLVIGEDVLTAQKIEIDLRSEVGTIYAGTILLKENHFIIKGDRISKIGKQTYAAESASLSTCDGDVPDWKITARKVNVTVEGFGTARDATFWARKAPVMYSPWLVFPAKRKRQTGLLAPEWGFSDRRGTEVALPLFWAIGDSQDATLYSRYMTKRGFKLGGEYRWMLDERSRGTLMADYLDDRKIDDGTGNSSEDYGYPEDGVLRTNSDRYWLRGKIDQALPWDFTAAVDIDYVSDQDYLHEFRYGYSGYYQSDSYFRDEWGRELEEYDDPVRTSRLNLNRTGGRYSFNSGIRWWDDARLRNLTGPDPTVQQLPFAAFDTVRQQILNWPIHFSLNSDYAYLYREDGTRSNRAFVYPRLLMPLKLKNYLFVEPSVGFSETFYYVSHFDPADETAAGGDRSLNRQTVDLRLDLFSEASRAFTVDFLGFDKIQHRLRPQVTYEYLPEVDQAEYPQFDALDRIEPRNLVTYALVNTFTSRRKTAAGEAAASEREDLRSAYREFGRFKIEQSYDIREQRADDPEEYADGEHQRPFSPIRLELDVFPGRYVSLSAETEYSTYENSFLAHSIGAGFEDDRGDTLTVDYNYRKAGLISWQDYPDFFETIPQETIAASTVVKLTERIFVDAQYERNIEEDKTTRTLIGVLFRQQCWSVKAGYESDEGDSQFAITILLHGLGEFGQTF